MYLPAGLEHGYTIHGPGSVRLLVVTIPNRDGKEGWGGYVADVETQGGGASLSRRGRRGGRLPDGWPARGRAT